MNQVLPQPIYPFNAYSVSGNITGELVYCNYGLEKDYVALEELGATLGKKIFLLRYGAPTSRSELIERAVHYGAIGIIFYSDPYDHAYNGQEYPHGWMLNNFGVQRGSVWNLYETTSDALSIGYPSKEQYFRAKTLPENFQYKIPSQPISASTASEIFSFLNDNSVKLPSTFKGNLNITYLVQSGRSRTVTLNVSNKLEDKESFVVCGTLFGYEEPDRYIMVGNHRDAWVYGAADPVSGSAVMTEIIRVLGQYKREDEFRPRRSIMACSWGAEEAGMQGSTEWADENSKFLSNKVIAYLNVDMAVEGNYTIQIKSLRHMIRSIFEAAKHVQSPDVPNTTLYQDMQHKHAKLLNLSHDLENPEYKAPGGDSDDIRFAQRYGIAVSDYRYIYNKMEFPLLLHNGHYHTLYDSFDWMSKFVDPSFEHHVTIGQLWLKHALILSNSLIIPFDVEGFCQQMETYFHEFEGEYSSSLKQHNVSLEFAKSRINYLVIQASNFQKNIGDIRIEKASFIIRRAINDNIMNFEKHFILQTNVGQQPLKHVYVTGKKFSGIIHAITNNPGNKWDNVRREITLLVWCVDMANISLDLSELMLNDF